MPKLNTEDTSTMIQSNDGKVSIDDTATILLRAPPARTYQLNEDTNTIQHLN